jgi:hypothetical protein
VVAVTPTRLATCRAKSEPVIRDLEELHSISVLGGGESALVAPLVRDQAFDAIPLPREQADDIARLVRKHLSQLHESGVEWWDDPAGELGISLWPTGLLVAPPSAVTPARAFYNISIVNTGVQMRTMRLPTAANIYPGDFRDFIPWSEIERVDVEGADQIERRPNIGAVALFGVLGLGASKVIRRSYLVLGTARGEYVFERQEMLPTELRAFISPVLRPFSSSDTGMNGPDALAPLLEAQAETNRLLNDILTELRQQREGR